MPYRVRAILFYYGDIVSWQELNKPGKKDDMADAFAQIEALCRHLGLPHLIDYGVNYKWNDLMQIKSYKHLNV